MPDEPRREGGPGGDRPSGGGEGTRGDRPLPDVSEDERGTGWGEDLAEEQRAADERLLADRPPHWDDR